MQPSFAAITGGGAAKCAKVACDAGAKVDCALFNGDAY
jgi:hypothetical protein